MPKSNAAAVAVVLAAVALTPQAAANFLTNPSFEDPITFAAPPFVGWEWFRSAVGPVASNSGVNPRTGSLHLSLSITNFDNAFVGVFQDVLGVTSGVSYTFSGWHMTSSSPFDATADIRIEWRDSVNNIEISRTANLAVVLTGSYASSFWTRWLRRERTRPAWSTPFKPSDRSLPTPGRLSSTMLRSSRPCRNQPVSCSWAPAWPGSPLRRG
jgi:hypothetical protein